MLNAIKVFLGTSASLMSLRRAVSDSIRELSILMEQHGVRLELLCWEDYKAEFTGDSKQLEYDRDLVLQSDIIITAFRNKVGDYTLHELQVARDAQKTNIKCYCLPCKENSAIEQQLQDEGFSPIHMKSDIKVVNDIEETIMDYADANGLMGTSQPVAGITKNFFATIPADMSGYRQSFSSMMRSLDMTTVHELDIHCLLYPYSDTSNLPSTHHYVALFKNQASDADISEMQQALQYLDDSTQPMEAMSIFQQKPDRLDKKNNVKYDIRANCPGIKNITDSRTIFTIGMHSLDKVRLQLLLWCLRTKTMSLKSIPNGFSCKEGMLYFNGHFVADMSKVEELSLFAGNQYNQRQAAATLMPSLYLALDRMMNGDLQDSEQYKPGEAIDCEAILSAQLSEAEMLAAMTTQTYLRWEADERRLRSRRDYLMQQAKDEKVLSELRKVQDTLLEVIRRRTAQMYDKPELVSELLYTIGIYDTYLPHIPYRDRNHLYEEVISTADAMGYIDPAVEVMRLNFGNQYARQLLHDKAIEQYETAISHLSAFDDRSRFIQRCLCHLYTTVIHSYYDFDYRHPRIVELLQELEEKCVKWSLDYNDRLFYDAILYAIRLRVVHESKNTLELVQKAESTFNGIMENMPLPVNDKFYGEVMCYLPNAIAAYYLDHFPDNQEMANQYAGKVLHYTKIQIANAQALDEQDHWESLTYLGKAYHHLGFLFSKNPSLSGLLKSPQYYEVALKYREKIYEHTKEISDEICIAETLVNYGAVLLTIHQVKRTQLNDTTIQSPIPYAQQALNIYAKYKDKGGIGEQLNYYKALQLYASSIFALNAYSEHGETQERIFSMLHECLQWSRLHPGNEYEDTFEGVSGNILKAIGQL